MHVYTDIYMFEHLQVTLVQSNTGAKQGKPWETSLTHDQHGGSSENGKGF